MDSITYTMKRWSQKGSQADVHLHQADLMFPLASLLVFQPSAFYLHSFFHVNFQFFATINYRIPGRYIS